VSNKIVVRNKTEIKQSRLKQTWNKFVLFQFYFSQLFYYSHSFKM